jgi:alpha-mannosidase
MKKAADRPTFIIRVYNPTPEEKSAEISFAFPLKDVWEVNLNEKREKQIILQEPRMFNISCPQNKIMTFEIEWEE